MDTIVTIFVRHSADCRYADDEFHKGCRCRKHLRWYKDGKQYRQKAGTRSWAEAELRKRELEDQLAGRVTESNQGARLLSDAIEIFKAEKKNQGISADVLGRYTRELERLEGFAASKSVFTVPALHPRIAHHYQSGWEDLYPSGSTRQSVQAHSGLAISDAVTLGRDELIHDQAKGPSSHRDGPAEDRHSRIRAHSARCGARTAEGAQRRSHVCVLDRNGEGRTAVSHWQEDFRTLFKDAEIAAGGSMVSHRLRDTFAVDLLENGVPLEDVSKLLGHESIKTTERHYAKWVRGRQDRLDALVMATWKDGKRRGAK